MKMKDAAGNGMLEFRAVLTITDTTTGETRTDENFVEYLHDGEWSDYMWREGNYSCDCNRFLFFERAAGKGPDFGTVECGDGRYRVESLVRKDTGEQLYSEGK